MMNKKVAVISIDKHTLISYLCKLSANLSIDFILEKDNIFISNGLLSKIDYLGLSCFTRTIIIKKAISTIEGVSILFHEIGHILIEDVCNKSKQFDLKSMNRRAELLASIVGLDLLRQILHIPNLDIRPFLSIYDKGEIKTILAIELLIDKYSYEEK